jgi:hypothetical protein
MTVTTFTATFSGLERNYYGSILWDKHSPRMLIATLSPMMSANEVGYSVWKSSAPYGTKGQDRLVRQMEAEAVKMGLKLESQGNTDDTRFLGEMPEHARDKSN